MKAVLFDLDGTLLPMDQDEFTKGYFKLLARKLATRGYEPAELVKNVWAGTAAMVRNDVHCSNEEAFWDTFTEIYGWSARNDIPAFNAFYANEFQQAQRSAVIRPRRRRSYIGSKRKVSASLWLPIRSFLPPPPRAVSAGRDWSRKNLSSIPPMKTSATASPIWITIARFYGGWRCRRRTA